MSLKDKNRYKDGLTLQEYSLKHAIPIETLIDPLGSNKIKKKLKNVVNAKTTEKQKTILKAYSDLNKLVLKDGRIYIYEEVRKLNYLFWLNDQLSSLGFEYEDLNNYSHESHKVITENFISNSKENINLLELKTTKTKDFFLYLAILLNNNGYILKDYIYLKNIEENLYQNLKKQLNAYDISIIKLNISNDTFVVRFASKNDCEKLKANTKEFLNKIPCFNDKFFISSPEATITKKLVFDSAHYITDHDAKCKNLHGGRYDIEISIKDRIDPLTGFVVDYSLIKAVVKNLIIDKFDHKTLNLTCPELSWRSSTEFLSIVIWEILIPYLPNLERIKIYETSSSFCEFKGNSLDVYLKNGPSEILNYFKNLNRNLENEENLTG